nr:polysaccharide deacetylase family sporulation protein PdaB [Sporohalobacter salinus]
MIIGVGIFFLGNLTSNLSEKVSLLTGSRLVPIYKVDTSQKKIAITLDGMWGAEYTEDILKVLREHDIKITFFFGGNWLEEYPEMAKKIAEDGHEIGNHTYSHPHLNSLSRSEIKKELTKNQEQIENLVGKQPKVFRPPFGEYSNKVINVAKKLNFKTIQWSIDSLDWKDPGVDSIVNRVLNKVGPGDIILMHNNATVIVEALEILVPKLKKQGYEIVKVSELTYDNNYYIESHSGVQKKRRNSGEE